MRTATRDTLLAALRSFYPRGVKLLPIDLRPTGAGSHSTGQREHARDAIPEPIQP
jgi:hypothetical protein